MTDHLHIHYALALAFVERHGYALLFLWVLGEQSAIPLPSVPLLLAAGALIHAGRLIFLPAILCCVIAALLADTIWFALGRYRGTQVLRLICRLSLEPDSCVRQTENAFLKYGMSSLLVSKFIPGLNAVAAPLAGHSKSSYARFALYDTAGAFIWSGAYFAVGYLFSEELETVIGYASRMGSNLFLLILSLFAAWIGWKWMQRRRFLRKLEVARITPAELQQRLTEGETLFIVDLRSGLVGEPGLIPGAVRIAPEELIARGREIPRDREIILFCS
jgi:membrane protein DedA with SNARE-associated domain